MFHCQFETVSSLYQLHCCVDVFFEMYAPQWSFRRLSFWQPSGLVCIEPFVRLMQ